MLFATEVLGTLCLTIKHIIGKGFLTLIIPLLVPCSENRKQLSSQVSQPIDPGDAHAISNVIYIQFLEESELLLIKHFNPHL